MPTRKLGETHRQMVPVAAGEATWREIENSLRAAFDRSSAPLVLLAGAEFRVAYANRSFVRLAGGHDLVGRPLGDAAPGCFSASFIERLGQAYRTARPMEREPSPSASAEDPYEFAYEPVEDDSGQVIGIIGLGRDARVRRQAEEALDRAESTLELATRASNLGVWDWRLDRDDMIVSRRAREIWGFSATQPVTKEMTGWPVTHPDDYPMIEARFRRALDPEIRDRSPYEFRVRRADGERRWVRAFGEAVFEERAGVVTAVRYVGTLEDVTEERQMKDALVASESRLRLAIDAGRMAVWSLNAAAELEVTPEFKRLLGLPLDAHLSGEQLESRYDPGEYERISGLIDEAARRKQRYIEFEQRYHAPDGRVRWFLVRAERRVGPGGVLLGLTGVATDITERREDEERQTLLAREVDHRANNLLAAVQGMVSLTKADTVAEFKAALVGRLTALGCVHQLLASARWVGADLQRLVTEEIRPYAADDPQAVSIGGPRVSLSPAVAQGVALALHELATNAVKHGAWSREGGAVSVSWQGGDGDRPLVLTWQERGGPPVTRPSRSGMGTKVLERAVSGILGGHTELDWDPRGLTCRLVVGPPEQAQNARVRLIT